MIILHVIDDTLIPQGAIIGFISEKSTLEDAKTKLLKLLDWCRSYVKGQVGESREK